MEACLDFSVEDNTEVAVSHLARLHKNLGGDYESVVVAVMAGICRRNPASADFYNYFLGNRIRNYRDLAAVQLNALAAPPGTSIPQTISDFGESIERSLRAQGIPEKFITGNNAEVMEDLVRELQGT